MSLASGWPLLVLLGLGFVHGLGADHLLALSTLALSHDTRRRRPGEAQQSPRKKALWIALRFGLSHAAVLAFFAAAVQLAGSMISPEVERFFEIVGGAVLIALGLVTLRRRRVAHDAHHHRHGPLFVGGVLALSGVRGLLLVMPAEGQLALTGLAIIAFALGVIAAMLSIGLFAASVSTSLSRSRSWAEVAVSLASVATGAYWVWSHLPV